MGVDVARFGNVQKSLMPKGVDHKRSSAVPPLRDLVQKSLMPKGVDHGCGVKLTSSILSCAKIFDAERR